MQRDFRTGHALRERKAIFLSFFVEWEAHSSNEIWLIEEARSGGRSIRSLGLHFCEREARAQVKRELGR